MKKDCNYSKEYDLYTDTYSLFFGKEISGKLDRLPAILRDKWEEEMSETEIVRELGTVDGAVFVTFYRDITITSNAACKRILRVTTAFLNAIERPETVWRLSPTRYRMLDDNTERYFLFKENAEDWEFDHEGISSYVLEEVPYSSTIQLAEYSEEVCV